MKGKILVTIQFSCLALLLVVTNWLTIPCWSFVIIGNSGILAFWAMAVMKLGNFNVIPTPVEKGVMVSNGPYKVIRHPMYTSIFVFAFALLAGQFDFRKLGITVVLFIGLIVKMIYEEGLLLEHHPEYKDYMKKTKRVIPFVW